MQSGATRCNGDRVRGLRTKHIAGGRRELAEHEGGGVGRRGLEMLPCRGERALERCGQRQAADPRFEGLQAAPVILCAYRRWRQQPLSCSDDEPQREQPFALWAARRFRDKGDEPLFRWCIHATSRCTAAATWSGNTSSRQRWCPSGHRSVPMAEQGRQPRSEERRVGKECRARWAADHEKKEGGEGGVR